MTEWPNDQLPPFFKVCPSKTNGTIASETGMSIEQTLSHCHRHRMRSVLGVQSPDDIADMKLYGPLADVEYL